MGEFNRISSRNSPCEFVVLSSGITPIRTIEVNSFCESSFAIFSRTFSNILVQYAFSFAADFIRLSSGELFPDKISSKDRKFVFFIY